MNLTYIYTLLAVFVVFAYVIMTDTNAAHFFDIYFRWVGVNVRRVLMMMWLKPQLMLQHWKMQRWMKKEMPRIMKEMQKTQETNSEPVIIKELK